MTKIYTKKGDKGNTGTFLGRMSKSDQRAVAIGTIDELNSWIGLCRGKAVLLDDELKRIQTNLLIIGSGLSGSGLLINPGEIRNLEKTIDKLTKDLPKLSNFIYPTGHLQVARSVARRAEREVVGLEINKNISAMKNTLKYLNRLSDALFTMGRWVNLKMRVKEEVWKS